MGEARRRRLAQGEWAEGPEALVEVVKLAETTLQHMFTWSHAEGQCWWRNAAVSAAAAVLGVRAEEVVGPAIYRAGPGRMDCIPFCDEHNRARFPALYHVWVETRLNGELWVIDVSTGHWKDLEDLTPASAAALGYPKPPADLHPIDYAVPLPERLVVPKRAVSTIGEDNLPPVGQFWYGHGTPRREVPLLRDHLADMRESIRMLARNHCELIGSGVTSREEQRT